MKTLKIFLLLVLSLICAHSVFAQSKDGLPLDRYYSAREGITWLSTAEVMVAGDVTFLATYQRGYKNKPVVGLKVVRFILTTPEEKPIWDKLNPADCFISYGGKRIVVPFKHDRLGNNNEEDMLSLSVPVQSFRDMVASGKFFVVINKTSYPVYGSMLVGLRALVDSQGESSSQAAMQKQTGAVDSKSKKSTAGKTAPKKSVRLTASQKVTAKRALHSLEDLDKWLKYYPSHNLREFKQRADDTAYVVNQSVAALPDGTVSTKLKKASDGFRAVVVILQITEGFADSESMNKIDKQMAQTLATTRQNIADVRRELAKK